jgi:hypothetical protein
MPPSTSPLGSPSLLRFARGSGRLDAYANLYRVGDGGGAAPLLIYVGGAIGRDEYVARMATEPIAVRDVVAAALAGLAAPRLDVLVCPSPIDTRLPGEDEPAGFDYLEHHVVHELLPAIGAEPSALGLVGYSAGAACAVHLAIVLEACAFATLGAARALALPELRRVASRNAGAGWRVEAAVFRNQGDESDEPAVLARRLAPIAARVPPSRPGGHPFVDYARNGAAAAAVRFVLERLLRGGPAAGAGR